MARKQWRAAEQQLEWTLLLDPEGNRVPAALLRQARCFEAIGQPEKARGCYRRIVENHPLSMEYGEAEDNLNRE